MRKARQNADEAIRRIMKERDQQIQTIHNKSDSRKNAIRNRKENLVSEVENLRGDFQSKLRMKREVVESRIRTRSRPRSDLTSVEVTEVSDNDSLRVVAQESLESVRNMTAACKKVRFARQRSDTDEIVGGLTGVKHSWELHGSIPIPPNISYPELLTTVKGKNSIILTNEVRSSLFEINLDAHRTRTIITDTHFDICDCACADDMLVVSEYNSKTVHVYDMRGNAIKSMTIPVACARVAITRDGVILVGDELNRKVFFLNSKNEKIVRTIPLEGNKINGIFGLRCGWIAVQTGINTITVYDELGALKETIHSKRWSELRCAVKRDTLYIMYKKTDDNTTYVGKHGANGRIEEIIAYKISKFLLTEFVVTSAGYIAINGDNEILTFNQAPGFEEILQNIK